MAVRIRMKKLGRKHRPYFRICAVDSRRPRNGRVIEELGTYDPMVPDTDARCTLNGERVKYWLSVGAQPSEKVSVLIQKYGAEGTHLQQQEAARAKLAMPKVVGPAAAPPAELAAARAKAESTDGEASESAEAPAGEAAPAEESAEEVTQASEAGG